MEIAVEEPDPPPQQILRPPSSPLLAYIHGHDDENLTLYPLPIPDTNTPILNLTTPIPLRGRSNWLQFGDWLLVYEQDGDYSLWNPLTAEIRSLPLLNLKPDQNIAERFLTFPPGNPNSRLILFEINRPSFLYCYIGENQIWIDLPIIKPSDGDFSCKYWNPVFCNGAIFSGASARDLGRIDLESDGNLVISVLPSSLTVPPAQGRWLWADSYYVESMDEIFLIYLKLDGPSDPVQWKELMAVSVYKLDLNEEKWMRVESFHDRAFFVGPNYKISLPATKMNPEIKGNHIYFQLEDDDCLYLFNMEDHTVTGFRPVFPDEPWIASFWILPELSWNRSSDNKIDLNRREEMESEDRELVQAKGDFGKLTFDVLSDIGECLELQDYLSFGTVNKSCRLAAPINRFKGFHGPPWLMFGALGSKVCNFIDVFHGKKYPMKFPNNEQRDVTLCYSNNGWCIMLKGRATLFLWNPFANKTIRLPFLEPGCNFVCGCGFSSSPDSPDCVVVMFVDSIWHYSIQFVTPGDDRWNTAAQFPHDKFKVTKDSNTVFHNGGFYFLNEKGELGFSRVAGNEKEKPGFKILEELECPCEGFDQKFLVECDGKLLSVFMGAFGHWFLVFKFDESEMEWVEVHDLGDYTLYISRLSSFSAVESPGMQNRIYFSRFYDKSVVYYSLETMTLHPQGLEEVMLNDFYHTSEQLLSSWIRAKF